MSPRDASGGVRRRVWPNPLASPSRASKAPGWRPSLARWPVGGRPSSVVQAYDARYGSVAVVDEPPDANRCLVAAGLAGMFHVKPYSRLRVIDWSTTLGEWSHLYSAFGSVTFEKVAPHPKPEAGAGVYRMFHVERCGLTVGAMWAIASTPPCHSLLAKSPRSRDVGAPAPPTSCQCRREVAKASCNSMTTVGQAGAIGGVHESTDCMFHVEHRDRSRAYPEDCGGTAT